MSIMQATKPPHKVHHGAEHATHPPRREKLRGSGGWDVWPSLNTRTTCVIIHDDTD
jgi:hypothetical protein